jgi:ABC-type branched-subunit amino acid transport system substrate-binding protein
MRNRFLHLVTGTALAFALSVSAANAQKKYDPGASDTEIKVGQTVPFSGPASAYASIGKTQAAYIKMINDQGGLPDHRHALQCRGPEISQLQEGAAAVRRDRRV